MTTAVTNLTVLADDLDSAVTAIGDVRGREREEVLSVLNRIRETATTAIGEVERKKKRKTPTTPNGFDQENDWEATIVRRM